MNKLLGFLTLVLIILFVITLVVWVPFAREQGYKAGKASSESELQASRDSSKRREAIFFYQSDSAYKVFERLQSTADSLLNITRSPHDATHYEPVPTGIDAAERKARILKGIERPL